MSSEAEDSNGDCKCLCYTHADEYTLILYHEQEVPRESASTAADAIENGRVVDEIEASISDIVQIFLESIKAKGYKLNAQNLAVGLTVRDARSKEGVSKLPMIVTLQQHLNAIQDSSSLNHYLEILAESYYTDKYLNGKSYGKMWVNEVAADEANGVPFAPLPDIGTTIRYFSPRFFVN